MGRNDYTPLLKNGRIVKRNKKYIFFGIALILLGFDIFFSGGGIVRYGYVTSSGGILIVIIGFFYILFSLKRDQKHNYDTNVKCKSCGTLHYSHELKNQRCPKCNGEVDNLKGFFKRNLQFKD